MKNSYKIFMVCLLTWLNLSCAKLESILELKQVFYHDSGRSASSIEFGKIVFYFSKDAKLGKPKIMQNLSDRRKRVEFRFDSTIAGKAVIDSARELFRCIDKKICAISLIVSSGKKPSLVLRIDYNPDKIVLGEYEPFDSIQHQKGFACTLFNKPLLDRLRPEKNSILRTVSSDSKHGVVIDMGHGGDDYGALSLNVLSEKEITFGIGMKLSALLRSQGFNVFYTRSDDSFVALDTRTSFSNRCDKADIVVSIHANSGGLTASGIETFCYKPLSVSSTSVASLSPNQLAYSDAVVSKRYDQSLSLAQLVQDSVLEQVKKKQLTVVNRGVKKAVSQMLLGTVKPTVLMEVGFVTHPTESALLVSDEYQNLIAHGIKNGICAYFKKN